MAASEGNKHALGPIVFPVAGNSVASTVRRIAINVQHVSVSISLQYQGVIMSISFAEKLHIPSRHDKTESTGNAKNLLSNSQVSTLNTFLSQIRPKLKLYELAQVMSTLR